MVGNDIVDINEAGHASNWKRAGFLDKLFTEQEKEYIMSDRAPFLMVWQLWSMKEASYKLYTQLNPGRFYNPKGFECTIGRGFSTVRFGDFHCFVQTLITSKYIISETRLHPKALISRVIKFKTTDHREQSKVLVAELLQYTGKGYQVRKSAMGIPTLHKGDELFSISLTHHGHYGAFAIG